LRRAAQGDGEAVPELPGVGLPEHRAGVVVAVRVERATDARVVGVVALPAAAPDHEAADGDAAGVDRAERRRGERDERPGPVDHRGRDALVPAGEPGTQQVEGVGGIAVRAGRAHRGAPIAARGHGVAGAFEQDLAVAVDDLGAAA
jgi:hypothetical protein